MSTDVSLLYDVCQKIEESDEKSSSDFQVFLDAVKNRDNIQKKLAIQMLFRFFDTFPDKKVTALNSLMNQLTEHDIEIRMIVIKNLPSTCKHNVEYVNQVGDVLAQLLNVHDSHELMLVNNSLCSLLKKHPKGTLTAIYNALTKADSINDKIRMLAFIDDKVENLLEGELTPLMKEKIVEVYQQMLKTDRIEELESVLVFLESRKSLPRRKRIQLLEATMEYLVQEHGDSKGSGNDMVDMEKMNCTINKLTSLMKSLGPLCVLSGKVSSYIFSKFEHIDLMHYYDRTEFLKAFADVVIHGSFDSPDDPTLTLKLFDYLKGLIPPLPSEDDGNDDGSGLPRNVSLEFVELEIVSIVVYALLMRYPDVAEVLTSTNKQWKPKFQYLASLIRVMTRKLVRDIAKERTEARTQLLNVANSIGLLTSSYLWNPPRFTGSVTPSWHSTKGNQKNIEEDQIPTKRYRKH